MILSMTGFGQAHAERHAERFTVTLKSVNHRYFETSFHLPAFLDGLESVFRSEIQKKIKRGRVTISVGYQSAASETVSLNEPLAKKYHRFLSKLKNDLGLKETFGVEVLIGLPGVLSYKKNELEEGERQQLVLSAMKTALSHLILMRQKEGQALEKDLAGRVSRISAYVIKVKKRVASVVSSKKRKMSSEALEGFLRSTDVSEEVTRIDFHLKSFMKHLQGREPKGKILDFVGQELQREINTLGAKIQDKLVAFQVVLIKDQIEKIREQVQNVE